MLKQQKTNTETETPKIEHVNKQEALTLPKAQRKHGLVDITFFFWCLCKETPAGSMGDT